MSTDTAINNDDDDVVTYTFTSAVTAAEVIGMCNQLWQIYDRLAHIRKECEVKYAKNNARRAVRDARRAMLDLAKELVADEIETADSVVSRPVMKLLLTILRRKYGRERVVG